MKATAVAEVEVEEELRIQLREAENEEFRARLVLSEAATSFARAKKQTAALRSKWLDVAEASQNPNR